MYRLTYKWKDELDACTLIYCTLIAFSQCPAVLVLAIPCFKAVYCTFRWSQLVACSTHTIQTLPQGCVLYLELKSASTLQYSYCPDLASRLNCWIRSLMEPRMCWWLLNVFVCLWVSVCLCAWVYFVRDFNTFTRYLVIHSKRCKKWIAFKCVRCFFRLVNGNTLWVNVLFESESVKSVCEFALFAGLCFTCGWKCVVCGWNVYFVGVVCLWMCVFFCCWYVLFLEANIFVFGWTCVLFMDEWVLFVFVSERVCCL